MDSYVTLGNCISAPSQSSVLCSPAQLGNGKKSRLEFSGFLSGTNSALDLADSIRKENLSSTDVQNFFSKYNYSEFLVYGKLQYVSPDLGFMMGVSPVRYQGQLEFHNPNLPLVSFVLRNDIEFFMAKSLSYQLGALRLNLGVKGTLLKRKEELAETTIVNFAAEPLTNIILKENLSGSFFDAGMSLELPKVFQVSTLFSDLGGYWGGKRDQAANFLYTTPDKVPRADVSLVFIPSVWHGTLQIGGGTYHFFNEKNQYGEQWTGTLSYYLGPVRLLSGFSNKLFRTGLGLSFSGYDVSVAQEWVNEIEVGRKTQPKFTLSVAASL